MTFVFLLWGKGEKKKKNKAEQGNADVF